MKIGVESAINRLGDRLADRTKNDRQSQLQRRNQVVDMFGVEFQRQGDAQTPAVFYISISPDMVYLERFEFKLIFSPFSMSVGSSGATGNTAVNIGNTNLSVSGTNITPNPHTHTNTAHNHSLSSGVSLFTSNVGNVTLKVEDIDITSYLAAQYNGQWINGEGVYPSAGLDNYDLLKVAGNMQDWRQATLLQPGYKKVEISGNAPFNVTLVNYLKYSHVNR